MYMGSMNDITNHFYHEYAPSAIVAALMVLIGLFVIGGSIFIRIFYKKQVDLIHLGNSILIAATWLLVESKLRQFIFPSSTAAMLTGFLMIAILPYPFLSYVNSVQNYRYQKIYMTLGICTIVNYAVVVFLQIMNIKDFFETMTSSHIIILALIAAMGVTTVLDVIKGYVRDYREVAIGFAGLMLAGVCEIGLTYIVDAQINGIALCIGLVLLLVAAGMKTVRDTINIEKEKQMAIDASESKAKFLANMSHEIRTPINTIIGMNEMVIRENQDETIAEYAYSIKSASQMLLSLINDVLDFSKIEAGKLQLVESNYYLGNMFRDITDGIEIRAKQKNLELIIEIDESLPSQLKGDEIRIKQILNNLLSNAVKYTERGSVTFGAKSVHNENGFCLKLVVKDTGMGIKKEDMEKLFASFQRLELSKNRYIEGTGLGLNISKQLVTLMNGTIEVESEYGKGSCFTVQIPQIVVDNTPIGKSGHAQKYRIPEERKEESFIHAPDARVLVVDDNRMNLRVIEALLKRTKIQMDFVMSGLECLEKTRSKKYDLILMDHMMPEPDGIQTLHMLREEQGNSNQNTNVIVLTANAFEGVEEEYRKEGFAGYLSKPIVPEKIEEMLEKYLIQESIKK